MYRTLVHHRQQFVSSHVTPAPPSHTHSYSLPDLSTSPVEVSPVSSPTKSHSPFHQNPFPKRHAPPPPSSAPPPKSDISRRSTEVEVVTRRKGQTSKAGKGQCYSLYVGSSSSSENVRTDSSHRYSYNSLSHRKAPPPPKEAAPVPNLPASSNLSQKNKHSSTQYAYASTENLSTGPSPSSSPQRRRRSNASMTLGRQPSSPEKSRRGSGGSSQGSPQQSPRSRKRSTSTGSWRSSKKSSTSSLNNPHSSSSPKTPSSPTNLTSHQPPQPDKSFKEQAHASNPSSASSDVSSSKGVAVTSEAPPAAEPVSARSSSTPTNSDLLPTSFTVKEANQIVEVVRSKAAVTHIKAQVAVSEVMAFLKEHAPGCSNMADALLRAMDQALVSGRVVMLTCSFNLMMFWILLLLLLLLLLLWLLLFIVIIIIIIIIIIIEHKPITIVLLNTVHLFFWLNRVTFLE